jgi:hypothetical protein
VNSRSTQRSQILNLLIAARGDWVTNRTREVDGQRHSWFRLAVGDLPAQRTVSGGTGNLSATAASFPEFGSLPKEPGYPD